LSHARTPCVPVSTLFPYTTLFRSRGFRVLPKRWIVERSLSWFSRGRRLKLDYERDPAYSEAWIYVASIHRMLKHLSPDPSAIMRSEEHTSELQSLRHLVCRLLLEK